jgi:hypothetical protein
MMIIPLLIALCFLVAVLIVIARQERQRFEEKFPPLTDAEFLARCSTGIDPDVALRVRRIVADSLCVPYERLHPSARFNEDLGAF